MVCHAATPRTLQELVSSLGGELVGDGSITITCVDSIESAQHGAITFLSNPKLRSLLTDSQASAFILPSAELCPLGKPCIVVKDPYLYYARLVALLYPPVRRETGVHPAAVVGSPIPDSCHIAANAYIGKHVQLGERVQIYPGAYIGDFSVIGDDTVIYPNVTLYSYTRLGNSVIVHAGAVIGSDGFGFAREQGEWVKIEQIGRVLIGNNVEIGAGTTIDRGAINDTVISDGVKLDNQIQIAHNVTIGENSAMAGCVGVAGSTHIGKNCTIAGAAMIVGHIDIHDNVHVSAGTLITRSLKRSGQYTGAYPADEHGEWLKNAVQIKRLKKMADRIHQLEKKLEALEKIS